MTKNSNLEIHPPNSESQVLDSFDSLLIPSEPPDLKNWFSSYKYDSPELNTGDGLEGCGSLRGNDSDEEGSYVEDSFKEKEENLREFGKIGKKDEITADEKVDSEGFIRFENPIEDNDAHQFVLDTGAAELCAFLDSWSIREMDGDIPNIKKWNVLYPVYINSKKTIAEGRRINATKACENPTCTEIGDCCSHLKIPFAIEIDKAYPRDFMQRGRVRFLLKREDGILYNPAISSRKQLMLHAAELVPRHPGRTKKQESVSTSTAGPSKSGKGGKKKR